MYFCVVLYIVCFASFSELFICICVLYYCHRLATQLQLNISYRIISYHIISYHIVSYRIVSYHIISYPIIYHIVSYHIISYYTIPYHNSLSSKLRDISLLRANCIVMIFLGVSSNVILHTVISV